MAGDTDGAESERLYFGLARYAVLCRACNHRNWTCHHPREYGKAVWMTCHSCSHIIRYRIGLDPFTYNIGD
jgi:RNase P subunit RPR2